MGTLAEIRDYLPEPNKPQKLSGKKSFRIRASAIGATLALALSVTAPFPTASANSGLEQKSSNPIQGWGSSCTPEGLQMFLVDSFPGHGRAVTVFECKSKGDGISRWYNDGTLYKDPRYILK